MESCCYYIKLSAKLSNVVLVVAAALAAAIVVYVVFFVGSCAYVVVWNKRTFPQFNVDWSASFSLLSPFDVLFLEAPILEEKEERKCKLFLTFFTLS